MNVLGCHRCGGSCRTPDGYSGTKVKCPGCGTILVVPQSNSESRATEARIPSTQQQFDKKTGLASKHIWLIVVIGTGFCLMVGIVCTIGSWVYSDRKIAVEEPVRLKTQLGNGAAKTKQASKREEGAKEQTAKKLAHKTAKKQDEKAEENVNSLLRDVARKKLRTALDSWLFGDSFAKFKKEHPEIQFGDYDRVRDFVVLKYEILVSRPYGKSGYQFSVKMTFRSEASTEIHRGVTYTVIPTDQSGKWLILRVTN